MGVAPRPLPFAPIRSLLCRGCRCSPSAHAALGGWRHHAFCPHVDRQNAVFLVAVGDEIASAPEPRATSFCPWRTSSSALWSVRSANAGSQYAKESASALMMSARVVFVCSRFCPWLRIRLTLGGGAGVELGVGDVRQLRAEARGCRATGDSCMPASSNFCAVSVRFILSVAVRTPQPFVERNFLPALRCGGLRLRRSRHRHAREHQTDYCFHKRSP